MGTPTNYYVDPAIAANSGTGTIGDPYGDLQYALNTLTRDATNGDQINIKAGTAEILAAGLGLTTYGTPAEGAPLILKGYTSVANDGGIGEINCNGNALWASTGNTFFVLAWLKIHSFGNAIGLRGGSYLILRCDIGKGSSDPSYKSLIYGAATVIVAHSYIHDAGTGGVGIDYRTTAYKNYIYNCPTGLSGCRAIENIIVDCTTSGINNNNEDLIPIIGNSIYCSTAATGTGIIAAPSGISGAVVLNNIIEGYSGVGGIGISGAADIGILGHNAIYNCTTPKSVADVLVDLGTDVTLAASAFNNPGAGDFSLKLGVVGAIEAAFPGIWYGPAATRNYADMGAVQKGAGASSGPPGWL